MERIADPALLDVPQPRLVPQHHASVDERERVVAESPEALQDPLGARLSSESASQVVEHLKQKSKLLETTDCQKEMFTKSC